jgi:hypothetical protein
MQNNNNREVDQFSKILRVIHKLVRVAEGIDRDEVRSMLIEELRSRGIEQPSSETMDAYLAMIARGISSRVSGRPAPKLPRRPGRLWLWMHTASPARLVRSAKIGRDIAPQYRPGRARGIAFFDPDRSGSQSPMEVVLDTSARDWLASRKLRLPRRMDPSGRLDIWLDSESYPDGRTAVRVHLMDRLIGHLRPEDEDVFRPAVDDSATGKYVVMTSGYIRRENDDVRFYIYRPML